MGIHPKEFEGLGMGCARVRRLDRINYGRHKEAHLLDPALRPRALGVWLREARALQDTDAV